MDTPFTRREFVRTGLGLIGMSATAPAFLTRTALALSGDEGRRRRSGAPDRVPVSSQDRVLVVLQLAGGNDGLNTVIPISDDRYYRARRRLAIPARKALRINDDFAFHPSATGLKALYDEGLLGVIHGVGYPNPNRSHFVSTDIWETGDPQQRTYTGWVGRYFDNCCSGGDCDPKLGIALTREAPLTMIGSRFSPVSFVTPDQLQWQPHHSNRGALDTFSRLNTPPETNGVAERNGPGGEGLTTLDYLRREAFDARMNMDEIREAAGRRSGGPRGSLTNHLLMVADMIAAGLPTRVYYVSLSGFDTHSGQDGRHDALMTQLSNGLTAFFKALKDSGHDQRVLLMTFSEFGRRVAENASGGTDHGTAAPMFLAGPIVRAGLHGRMPGLGDLDAGDLKHTTDFRAVYATILQKWMRADVSKLIPGTFPPLDILRL